MATTQIDLATLADRLANGLPGASGARVIIAIAGAPGSGKSTMAEKLVEELNARAEGQAALLPMDGFHYDDLHLVPAGLRPRKGAPNTFDVGGLFHCLKRLRAHDELFVAVPVFDRILEIARGGARLIPSSARIIVAEGNYLLLAEEPWARLAPLFDLTVMIEVSEEELKRRLHARWHSLGLAADEITAKVEGNDLPNGRYIRTHSRDADFCIMGA